jgi:hypothetical protein
MKPPMAFPHPSIYNVLHHLQYTFLPAPFRYTPTYAPGYWIETTHPTGTIKRLNSSSLPFPMRRAVVNSLYELDCVMVGPGVLVVKTPLLSEFKPWFHRLDFEKIFGHQSLGVSKVFPREFIPGSLLIATNVQAFTSHWEPTLATKAHWARQSKWPCVIEDIKCRENRLHRLWTDKTKHVALLSQDLKRKIKPISLYLI